jgi:hypothetical protein
MGLGQVALIGMMRVGMEHFFGDGKDAGLPIVSYLPTWVRAPKHITDDHLIKLAIANAAVLATVKENLPGSCLIPQ